MTELNKLLGIKTKLSTAYHPQTDGQTERTNMELEQYLRLFVNHRQTDWADWLPIAEFSYNNKIHSSTKHTPFYLDSGIHPRMGIEPIRDIKYEEAERFTERMKSARTEAEASLVKAAADMKRYADYGKQEAPEYQIGQKVWLEASNYTTDRPSKKLSHKRLGPYPIIEIVNPHAIRLKLPKQLKIHPVFNVLNVRPFMEPSVPGQTSVPPEPVIIDEEEEHEVEQVLNSRLRRGKLQYLVKWKGYTDEHNTWEPEAGLEHAPQSVKDFHRLHPGAPQRIRAAEGLFRQLVDYEDVADDHYDDNGPYTDFELTKWEYERTKHIPTGRLLPREWPESRNKNGESEEGEETITDEDSDGLHEERKFRRKPRVEDATT
jgi:hypothetical protein